MMQPQRITPYGQGYSLAYFTTNSLLAGDKEIILIRRHENGINQIAWMNMESGELRQLSHVPNTPTPAFDGSGTDNILDASISIDYRRGIVYYLRGRTLFRTDKDGNEVPLAMLPMGKHTCCSHISSSGRKFLISTADERMLCGGDGSFSDEIDAAAQRFGYSSQLRVISTENGELLQNINVNRAYITHVQFHPIDDRILLYNHEWASDCGIRRVWFYDGSEHVQLRTEGDGRSRGDWTCHEVWAPDGKSLIYHGGYCHDARGNAAQPQGKDGIKYLGRAVFNDPQNLRDYTLQEIALPEDYVKYGHYIVGENGSIATDGYYQLPGEAESRARYISLVLPDWEKRTTRWVPLCEHRSSWSVQRSHPHPIFDHGCRYLYFNSDFEGFWAVYRVEVPQFTAGGEEL